MTRHFVYEVNAPGLAKTIYSGKNSGVATARARFLRDRCGWDARWPEPGSVRTVAAPNQAKALEKVFALQIARGILPS